MLGQAGVRATLIRRFWMGFRALWVGAVAAWGPSAIVIANASLGWLVGGAGFGAGSAATTDRGTIVGRVVSMTIFSGHRCRE
ncbi:hypothetical protein J6524_14540 [Bradyrhizobium sp. WSM 1738]|uniref:hypothetical protein n=1 Tax=Bradyrhizobium hereditatis TaxID=2821405 RepID=UPI001CE30EFC|nr:hypothetical protein [Bradyrhizobium hereditatis]MCA6116102.1 hypothetical protein [Bradyrhizobium hereditatis]